MSILARLLIVMVATIATAEYALARVVVKERTRYYTVSGKTGAQLLASIRRRGSRGAGARHAIATTRIAMSVQTRQVVRGSRCVYAGTTVVLNLTYSYPRWANQRGASPRVRQAWKRFLGRVQAHERRHGAIAKRYAARVDQELRRTRRSVRNGCRDTGNRQSRRFARLAAQHERQHIAFDRREARAGARVRRLQRALGRQR